MFTDGDIEIKRKNSSYCSDNIGQDICFEYAKKTCLDSFINTFNCSTWNTHATIRGNGKRLSSFTNVVKCDNKREFIHQDGSSFTLENCCFFRLSQRTAYGSPVFINCICDFAFNGITKCDVESTHPFTVAGGCNSTFLFSKRSEEMRPFLILIHVLL